jgi:hypothetical protein
MKHVITCLAVLFTFTALQAQSTTEEESKGKFKKKSKDKMEIKVEWMLRLNGRLNSSYMSGQSESWGGKNFGPSFGIEVPVFGGPGKSEVVLGMNFSQEGSPYSYSGYVPGGGSESVENKVVLNYLRLPLFLRMKTKKNLYFDAGFQPGILLSAKDKFNGETADLKEDFNGFNMGGVLGAGYSFTKKIGATLHFFPGLSNINRKEGSSGGKKDRVNTISAGVFYQF